MMGLIAENCVAYEKVYFLTQEFTQSYIHKHKIFMSRIEMKYNLLLSLSTSSQIHFAALIRPSLSIAINIQDGSS